MRKLQLGFVLATVALALPAACSKSPGAPSVSFTAPSATQPANGVTYKFVEQPVTLTITNSVRTANTTVTYSVEVATDAGFANKVFTKEGIAEGGATTSLVVGGLAGGATYYWHWKAVVDGVTGQPSPTQSFVVRQQVILNPPVVADPASGATVSETRPTFTVTNATRTGPAETVYYEFEVSNSSTFATTLARSGQVQEQNTRTSWQPTTDLPAGALFWRVRASDPANLVTTAFNTSASVQVEPFDPKKAVFWYTGADIANWDQTAKITSVAYTDGYLLIDFDKRTGPGAWPETGGSTFGALQYTAGMCFRIGGTWHCSAPVQFWAGRELEAGGPWRDVSINWFYDPARWGPMAGYQPECGERVAIWVGQGNLRGPGGNTINQRSNFAIVTWCAPYQAN